VPADNFFRGVLGGDLHRLLDKLSTIVWRKWYLPENCEPVTQKDIIEIVSLTGNGITSSLFPHTRRATGTSFTLPFDSQSTRAFAITNRNENSVVMLVAGFCVFVIHPAEQASQVVAGCAKDAAAAS
jgi:hypothetical protein